MNKLDSQEVASYLEVLQLKQIRFLKQKKHEIEIVILSPNTNEDEFIKSCQNYADDIGVNFKIINIENNLAEIIKKINSNKSIDGVIVHPCTLNNENSIKEFKQLDPKKDVSGISQNPKVIPVISKTLDWLLESYNINLLEKKIIVFCKNRPIVDGLNQLWKNKNVSIISSADCSDSKIELEAIKSADIFINFENGSISNIEQAKNKAVVIDARYEVNSDLFENLRQKRPDLIITPSDTTILPLLVSVIFSNLIELENDYFK